MKIRFKDRFVHQFLNNRKEERIGMKIHSSPLPFSGLGFDLAPVHLRARLMTRLRIPRTPAPESRGPEVHAPTAHGYGLLVYLSREIRGG
jgi:hypothetical protein